MADAIVQIGNAESECLTLEFHGRLNPDSLDFWDGNWVRCKILVRVPAFEGTLDGSVRIDEIARFRNQVVDLYRMLNGVAAFETLEKWFWIRMIGDERGHVRLTGHMSDDPVDGNILSFRLILDQTFLPSLMKQLQLVLDLYPAFN